MAEHYGRTHEIGGVLRMTVKPMLATFAGMVPVGFWDGGLPGRRPESSCRNTWVRAGHSMGVIAAAAEQSFSDNNVFNVVRRQDLYVIGILIGMLSYFECLTFLFKDAATVSNFPQAMLIGRGVQLIACYILLIPLVLRTKAAA